LKRSCIVEHMNKTTETGSKAASDSSEKDGGLLRRWFGYLQQPVDGSSLAVFRMAFSLFMLWMIFEYWHNNWIALLSSKVPFHFSYLSGMPTFAGDGIYILFLVMALLAVQIGVGILYRPACLLFCCAETYVFMLEKSFYQNHLYLVCLLSFLLFVVSANRTWSFDNIEAKLAPFVPRWNYLLLKFQFVIVYFFGGIAKLNPDWLHGEPQTSWMQQIASTDHTFGSIIGQPWFAFLITYGGIAVDLSVGFLLAYRPTFWIGATIAIVFHLINSHLFSIGIFPWMMIASIGLFAPEDWPRRVLRKFFPSSSEPPNPVLPAPDSVNSTSWRGRLNICTLVFLHLYILVQILIPLRRFLYPGDVNWTEQGHRFAWGMKLRDKAVPIFSMAAIDPKSGVRRKIDLSVLEPYQLTQMKTHPDMILQFAHAFADEKQKQTGVRPIVHARCIAMLNRHPGQDMIVSDIDLANEPIDLMPARFILPLMSSADGKTTMREVTKPGGTSRAQEPEVKEHGGTSGAEERDMTGNAKGHAKSGSND
jgi:vitamin K-dependent gamma-carboxylase